VGSLDSSIIYSTFIDGRAIRHRNTKGMIVQMDSISWLSVLNLLKLFCVTGKIVMYSVSVVSKVIITILWSWKYLSCSIMGLVLS